MSSGRHRLVLLPGMDGTGSLFADFITALPPDIEATVVRYPTDRTQSYAELLEFLEIQFAASAPFVLVAESFSAPLAMQWAAKNRPNLKGIVICAGFATSPARGWLRDLCLLSAPLGFLLPPPTIAIKGLLLGRGASGALVATVRAAIRSVKPRVLSHRLRLALTFDSREALSKVSVPVLFIRPMEDSLVSLDRLEEMRRIVPAATVQYIAGPHLILQARPGEAAEVITRFVRQLL